ARDIRSLTGDSRDRVVVERVERVPSSMRASDLDDRVLDPLSLQLDVHGRAIADGLQYLVESRNPSAASQVDAGQRFPRASRDALALDDVVMVHDDDLVTRDVNVELHSIRAALERQQESRQGIFNALARRAAMRHFFEANGSGRHGGELFRNLA